MSLSLSPSAGKWKKLSSGLSCLNSCRRQENRLSTSASTFPNRMFLNPPDFFLVIRKLWWSCQPIRNKFGPKRIKLDEVYPNLCQFYDSFIYPNIEVNNSLANTSYTLEVPISVFLQQLTITPSDLDLFQKIVLKYSEKNLVKITAYIEKVFAEQYITDEAVTFVLLLLNNFSKFR